MKEEENEVGQYKACDDVSGEELEHGGAVEARAEDMHEFAKHGIYKK